MSPRDKPLVWLRGEVKTAPFGSDARIEAGFLLRRLQRGESLSLPHSRPMPAVGTGCHELRITDGKVNWRIMYHIAIDAVVILDLFKTMRKNKRRRLERAGWTLGDAGDFLGMPDDERRFVETKLALAAGLRQWREHLGFTQTEAARRFRSSQSRVAKMEAADQTVTTDLLLRSLFRLGASRRDVARILSQNARARAA
jgi:phage-related protein